MAGVRCSAPLIVLTGISCTPMSSGSGSYHHRHPSIILKLRYGIEHHPPCCFLRVGSRSFLETGKLERLTSSSGHVESFMASTVSSETGCELVTREK
jgi:hypothetical protein